MLPLCATVVLVEAGADKKSTGDFGLRPLHWAAEYGCLEMVRFLVEAGAEKDAVAAASGPSFGGVTHLIP